MEKSFKGTGMFTLLAILLSAGSIFGELTTGICTGIFFDPIPTLVTTILACFVPVSLVMALYLLNAPFTKTGDRIVIVCIGISLSVSAAFSLLFLPTLPFCAIGILAMGMGALGLSPYLTAVASLLLLKQWHSYGVACEDAEEDIALQYVRIRRKRGRRIWFGVPVAVVIMFWGPIVTGCAGWMLSRDTVSVKNGGLFLLRHGLSREAFDAMLRENHSEIGGELYTPEGAERETLGEAYRFLYGISEGTGQRKSDQDIPRFFFDPNTGGDLIGAPVPGLDLKESTIDVTIMNKDGTGYTEWTMTFHNKSAMETEARAYLRLPSYGVVSKVSLWIDGKECSAAFGPTAQVKNAYRKVVSVRRDPLLVTWVAPEVIRLQCFPVPPEETMKVRIGIIAPLLHGGYLQLPSIQYCNFGIPSNLQHAISAAGTSAVAVHGIDGIIPAHAIAMCVDDTELCKPSLLLQCEGGLMPDIQSEILLTEEKPVLVIDGVEQALTLRADVAMIARYFSKVYCAGPYDFAVWDGKRPFGGFLKAHARYRTVDAAGALDAAVREAAKRGVPVVWAYGETTGKNVSKLMETIRRSKGTGIIGYALDFRAHGFPMSSGICRHVVDVPVIGGFDRDVRYALDRIATVKRRIGEDASMVPAGGRFESGLMLPVDEVLPGTLLHCLLVHSQVMCSWYDGEISDDLIECAVAARLVTPVTGAVVLENRQQYEENGLDPDTGIQTVVTVDEPGLMILVVLGLCTLLIAGRIKKRRCHYGVASCHRSIRI